MTQLIAVEAGDVGMLKRNGVKRTMTDKELYNDILKNDILLLKVDDLIVIKLANLQGKHV